jgi:hypothetical protein
MRDVQTVVEPVDPTTARKVQIDAISFGADCFSEDERSFGSSAIRRKSFDGFCKSSSHTHQLICSAGCQVTITRYLLGIRE